MKKLFIIGNGFDLAHGIPSTFNHFKEYLRFEYEYDCEQDPSLWLQPSTDPKGDESYNIEYCAHIIDFMICTSVIFINSENKKTLEELENWSCFEKAMGMLEFSMIEEDIIDQYDKEGDINLFHTGANYEDAYRDLTNVILKLPLLFSEWINEIHVPDRCFSVSNIAIYKFFMELIDKEDVFLNFNYTDTLENLYEVENVLHIHGNQDSPVVGHNNDNIVEEQIYYQDTYINNMNEVLKKPTNRILMENKQFFEDLSGVVDSIYSYGFSFGEVDLIYIKEIISQLDSEKIIWYLNEYDKEQHVEFQKIIRSCGFIGSFSVF
ncbi:MAG: bacteriophage abortive infection AbiH family protein [Brochothrix thermosphacta]|uniref:bacteriophage abortive infection AbiH family protein n=1 Tax=Brochothrix thermosphacta TaxID=2756 RepID=UPI003F907B99